MNIRLFFTACFSLLVASHIWAQSYDELPSINPTAIYTTDEGEELSTRKIKLALKDLIAKEDKKKPMSDDALQRLSPSSATL